MSHLNPVHIFTAYFYIIRINMIVPFTDTPPKWPAPFMFCEYNFLRISQLLVRYIPQSHTSGVDQPDKIR
jgi:hypothetical protein